MRLLAGCLLMLRAAPFFLTQFILNDAEFEQDAEQRRFISRMGLLVNLAFNISVMSIVDAILFDVDWTFSLFGKVWNFSVSYEDIGTMAASLIPMYILAILLGWVLRLFFYGPEMAAAFSPRKRGVFLLSLTCAGVLILAGGWTGNDGWSHVSLREVCRKTTETVRDRVSGEESEETVSYITLHNDGVLPVRLDRVYLSDNDDQITAHSYSDVVIPAGSDYRITMLEKNSLNIRKNGGTMVSLLDGQETVRDSVMLPELTKDTSYRRTEDGKNWEVYTLDKNENATPPPSSFFQFFRVL